MRVLIIAVMLLVGGAWRASAESLGTAEGAAVTQMVVGYDLFKMKNGRTPVSWPELESVFEKPLNKLDPFLQPATRYAFLETPLDVPGQGFQIVILSRSPFHDQYKMRGFFGVIRGSLPSSLGRNAVVVDRDGHVFSADFPETQVRKMFAEAGVPLPAPDTLGPRPYESRNRALLYYWIAAASLGVIFLGVKIIGKFRGQASPA